MALVACGDDDTGGAGGNGEGGNGSGGAGSTTTSGSTTSGGEGGDDAGSTTTTTGGGEGGGGEGGAGGGDAAPPCADECADEPGCDESPANPADDSACAECVRAEGAMGINSECASGAAFSPCCQDDANCPAYVTCVVGGGTTCDEDHPEGAARAAQCVLAGCGECGSPE